MTNYRDEKEEKDIITVNSDGRIRNKNKNPKFDNHYFKWGLTFFVTFLACILSIYIVFYHDQFKASIHNLNKILSPVYVGFIIAYLFSPLLNSLEKKVMYPIYKKQITSTSNMAELQKKQQEIQKKYANDKETMNLKLSELYKENGSPMAGCLPMIIQLIVISGL